MLFRSHTHTHTHTRQDARTASIFTTALSEAMGKALPEERVAAVKIKMEVDAETKIEVETDAHAERAGASDRKALKSHETAEHVEEWRYAAVTVSVLALASSPPPPIPGERARLCLALPSLASAPVHHL